VVLSIYFFQLLGAIYANVLIGFVTFGILRRAVKQECLIKNIDEHQKGWGNIKSIIWSFSLPALLSNLMTGIFIWLANTILVSYPSGYSELALVNASNQWRNALLFFPTIFSSVALPLLSSTIEKKDASKDFTSVMEMTQNLIAIIIIPLSTVFVFFSDQIMSFYGSNYISGSKVLITIVIGISISAIGSAAGTAIQAKGWMWLGAILNASWGLAYILLTYLLVPNLGALSLGISFLVAHFLLASGSYLFLFSTNSISKMMLKKMAYSSGFLFIIAATSWFISRDIKLFLVIPVFVICLLFCYQVFVTDEMKNTARSLFLQNKQTPE
jgi:O-antigen/teichoic acid export membrane protein